jgi:hypothetical protein
MGWHIKFCIGTSKDDAVEKTKEHIQHSLGTNRLARCKRKFDT